MHEFNSSDTFRCQGQLVSHPGQMRQRSGIHLSHDLATSCFYSDLADAEVVSDLLVGAAGHHQGHYLALTGGEGFKARAYRGDCLYFLPPCAISSESLLNGVQQILIAERLGQELDRSTLYRPDRCRRIR